MLLAALATALLAPPEPPPSIGPAKAGAPGVPAAKSYWVYLGTYTGNNSPSKGIYRAKLDTATGKLSEPELAAELTSPSFLAVGPNNKFLYAVGETAGKDGGGVFAFAIDPASGNLTKLNEATSGGAGPCHVSVHPDGRYAIVANYGGGSTKILGLTPDGKIDRDKYSFIQHNGSGPNKDRQKEPHAHCSFFDPTGRFALTADLGTDQVWVWRFDPATGIATGAGANITLPPGSGPRHFAVSKDGQYAYVCGELDSTVNVVKLDLEGKSEVVQTLSTLAAPVKGNSTAECILSPDGKFVYVSNRGHNSIAAFKVGEDRKLTAVGHITGDIKIPRNFAIDPSGKWMLIASQDGDKVGVWAVDPATGLAKETGDTIKVGRPVCVKFVPAG